ncbi:uncharacterized protein C8R40DRAFT_1234017 [Lentinula edodes]|uniref:uncharacterized protein n=1 Tax=Lentinula edodes TaxID=5353 RepID=UPI001E8CFA68|nr:uncharacterized protein C8R40DRAFT_1234017 [Lentinula edodes]KAH7879544.1 hypothetical protein C8R40DRAFT_1234017 [Lentinula edodes]
MLILDNSNDLINPQVTEQEIGSDLEPLQDEEVIQFRAQVLNMGVLSSDGMNSRERELARMVLRLTESSRPSSAQIASQAAIILDLSTQRDYLIQQAEEERARWESEREGWERASEALIAQRNAKDHYSNRHQELERYCSILQTDNEDLRRREQQLLKRLTSLEDEMVKLKPVLLLDPFPATASESSLSHAAAYLASLPYPAASGKEAVRAQRSRRKKLEAKHKDIDHLDQEVDHVAANISASNDSPNSIGVGTQGTSLRTPNDLDGEISHSLSYIPDQLQDDSNVLPFKSVRSEKHVSRRTEPPGTLLLWPAHIQPPVTPPSLETPSAILGAPSAPGLNERSENAAFDSAIEPPLASSLSKPARPLTSDARMEHLLLAARMIGRKRAAFAAGIVDAELEKGQKERKEKEKEWREKEKAKKQKEREREKKEREIAEKSKSERSKEKTRSTATLRSSAGGSRSVKGKGKEKALPKSSGVGKTNSLKRTPSRSGRELEGILDDEVIAGSSKQRRTKQTRPKPRALSASSSAGSTQKTQLTGMDSLLSAARSMMDPGSNQFITRDKAHEGGIDIDSNVGSRRPASELGGYEDTDMLPPAKRQKSLVVSSNRPMRTPSALDVLADQAAAAVSTSAASSDMDSTILEGKMVKNDLEDEDAEGEYEDDPADSNSVTRLNSPTTNTDGPRRSSRRSASSRSVINTRVISSAKSPTKGLS